MNDKVKIVLKAGKGGDGAIAFRHEKSVTYGGPFGGNGGKAGDIYIQADRLTKNLNDYRFGKTFITNDGEDGKSKLQYGKDSQDLILKVPLGTVIEDLKGNVIKDLCDDKEKFLICKGGRGGRGNATFKSSVRRTPNIAENGLPGESKTIYLELKLIADVGLVGFPNVGKSTLINSLTRAKSQIGDYAFTTLEPHLGVCYLDEDRYFVIADIPGLIKGASEGKGLGIQFLRHIERCRVLLHIIDVTSQSDLISDFESINNELFNYSNSLKSKKMIIALNKVDESFDQKKINDFINKFGKEFEIFQISAKEAINLDQLKESLYDAILKEDSINKSYSQNEVVYKPTKKDLGKIPEFSIKKIDNNTYEILGDRVIRTKRLINLSTDEGIEKLLVYLDKISVNEKLIEAGCKSHDTVILDDFSFEFFE